MQCEQIRARYSPFLERELPATEQRQVAAHLKSCGPCRSRFDELRGGLKTLGELPRRPLPEDFLAGVLAQVPATAATTVPATTVPNGRWRIAAALLFGLVVGLLLAIGFGSWRVGDGIDGAARDQLAQISQLENQVDQMREAAATLSTLLAEARSDRESDRAALSKLEEQLRGVTESREQEQVAEAARRRELDATVTEMRQRFEESIASLSATHSAQEQRWRDAERTLEQKLERRTQKHREELAAAREQLRSLERVVLAQLTERSSSAGAAATALASRLPMSAAGRLEQNGNRLRLTVDRSHPEVVPFLFRLYDGGDPRVRDLVVDHLDRIFAHVDVSQRAAGGSLSSFFGGEPERATEAEEVEQRIEQYRRDWRRQGAERDD